MNVRIVDGKRVIEANGRDRKVMREAAGLFGFIWDNAQIDRLTEEKPIIPLAFSLEDVENAKELLEATLAVACEPEDDDAEEVEKAAGATT